jgi:hypothetical protein
MALQMHSSIASAYPPIESASVSKKEDDWSAPALPWTTLTRTLRLSRV